MKQIQLTNESSNIVNQFESPNDPFFMGDATSVITFINEFIQKHPQSFLMELLCPLFFLISNENYERKFDLLNNYMWEIFNKSCLLPNAQIVPTNKPNEKGVNSIDSLNKLYSRYWKYFQPEAECAYSYISLQSLLADNLTRYDYAEFINLLKYIFDVCAYETCIHVNYKREKIENNIKLTDGINPNVESIKYIKCFLECMKSSKEFCDNHFKDVKLSIEKGYVNSNKVYVLFCDVLESLYYGDKFYHHFDSVERKNMIYGLCNVYTAYIICIAKYFLHDVQLTFSSENAKLLAERMPKNIANNSVCYALFFKAYSMLVTWIDTEHWIYEKPDETNYEIVSNRVTSMLEIFKLVASFADSFVDNQNFTDSDLALSNEESDKFKKSLLNSIVSIINSSRLHVINRHDTDIYSFDNTMNSRDIYRKRALTDRFDQAKRELSRSKYDYEEYSQKILIKDELAISDAVNDFCLFFDNKNDNDTDPYNNIRKIVSNVLLNKVGSAAAWVGDEYRMSNSAMLSMFITNKNLTRFYAGAEIAPKLISKRIINNIMLMCAREAEPQEGFELFEDYIDFCAAAIYNNIVDVEPSIAIKCALINIFNACEISNFRNYRVSFNKYAKDQYGENGHDYSFAKFKENLNARTKELISRSIKNSSSNTAIECGDKLNQKFITYIGDCLLNNSITAEHAILSILSFLFNYKSINTTRDDKTVIGVTIEDNIFRGVIRHIFKNSGDRNSEFFKLFNNSDKSIYQRFYDNKEIYIKYLEAITFINIIETIRVYIVCNKSIDSAYKNNYFTYADKSTANIGTCEQKHHDVEDTHIDRLSSDDEFRAQVVEFITDASTYVDSIVSHNTIEDKWTKYTDYINKMYEKNEINSNVLSPNLNPNVLKSDSLGINGEMV